MTCVLRPADLSVAISVVVGKNLLMKEIELAKVSSEVGLVFVNCWFLCILCLSRAKMRKCTSILIKSHLHSLHQQAMTWLWMLGTRWLFQKVYRTQTMSFGFHYCPAQISEADLEGEKLVDVHRLWVASSRLEPIRSSLGLSWHQRTLEEKIQRQD